MGRGLLAGQGTGDGESWTRLGWGQGTAGIAQAGDRG